MKSIYLAAIAAIFSLNASAKVIAEADAADGAVFVFHDNAGSLCVNGAMLVEYVAKDGSKIAGCYVPRGTALACAFTDGDVGAVPMAVLREPKRV